MKNIDYYVLRSDRDYTRFDSRTTPEMELSFTSIMAAKKAAKKRNG